MTAVAELGTFAYNQHRNMKLDQAESRFGMTLSDRRRNAMLDPADSIHDACDFLGRLQAMLGKILGMSGQMARSQGCNDGFRVVINNGVVGRQEVYHLHIHVTGGDQPLVSRQAGTKPA